MKKVKLKIIPKPDEGTATVFTKGDSPDRRPYISGKGSYKFACGFCEFILVSGTEFARIQHIVFHCPQCKKYNISNPPVK